MHISTQIRNQAGKHEVQLTTSVEDSPHGIF